ncbi:hypothetical protein [Aliiroseovarius crassostreae]|uniref:hypothetical protein n=1 Tax=Aliiroseovarius crassostreae TaxID=154981 RepID=UPI003C7DCDB5
MTRNPILTPFAILALTVLAGCEGHQYEPRDPGVSFSGEAKAGVKYVEGQGSSVANDVDMKVSIGGSF